MGAGNAASASADTYGDDIQGGGALRATCDWTDCSASEATLVRTCFQVHRHLASCIASVAARVAAIVASRLKAAFAFGVLRFSLLLPFCLRGGRPSSQNNLLKALGTTTSGGALCINNIKTVNLTDVDVLENWLTCSGRSAHPHVHVD